jgi:catabolite regulation protein CreA
MPVLRFDDAPRSTRVYLNRSDRIIDASPKTGISIVVLRRGDAPWTHAPRH